MTDELFTLPDHHERAICADVTACLVCVLEPLDGESSADWLARLRGEVVRQSKDENECVNGHLWTPETTTYTRDGWRACVLCKQEAQRRHREKRLDGHRRCSRCKGWRLLEMFKGDRLTCTPCLVARRGQTMARAS